MKKRKQYYEKIWQAIGLIDRKNIEEIEPHFENNSTYWDFGIWFYTPIGDFVFDVVDSFADNTIEIEDWVKLINEIREEIKELNE